MQENRKWRQVTWSEHNSASLEVLHLSSRGEIPLSSRVSWYMDVAWLIFWGCLECNLHPLGVEDCDTVALESSALLQGWEVLGFQVGRLPPPCLVELKMVPWCLLEIPLQGLHPLELHSMDTAALCVFAMYHPMDTPSHLHCGCQTP